MTNDEIDVFAANCSQLLSNYTTRDELFERIVNTPFAFKLQTTSLGLGIIVLLLKNQAEGTVDRVAISRTEHAQGAMDISVKEFEAIRIPLKAEENILVQVIERQEFRIVTDWKYMFIPALTAQEARLNQAGAAIDCSVIYPIDGFTAGGALIFSYFEPMSKLTNAHHRFMGTYSQSCARYLQQTL